MSCIEALRARILPGHEPLPSATKEFKRRLWFTSLQVLLNCWWSPLWTRAVGGTHATFDLLAPISLRLVQGHGEVNYAFDWLATSEH